LGFLGEKEGEGKSIRVFGENALNIHSHASCLGSSIAASKKKEGQEDGNGDTDKPEERPSNLAREPRIAGEFRRGFVCFHHPLVSQGICHRLRMQARLGLQGIFSENMEAMGQAVHAVCLLLTSRSMHHARFRLSMVWHGTSVSARRRGNGIVERMLRKGR